MEPFRTIHSTTQRQTQDRRMNLDHIINPSSLPNYQHGIEKSKQRRSASRSPTPDDYSPESSDHFFDERHSSPILQTPSYSRNISPPDSPRSCSSSPPPPQRLRQRTDPDSAAIVAARRDLSVAITRPSPRRGYLKCRLCEREVWGPNGRYHIDKCPVPVDARETARSHGARLTSVGGIPVHPDVFKSVRRPRPKPAKIAGFVMSHSVSVENPRQAPTEDQLDAGVKRGRKGYVRCLRCNCEVFAPNARYHSLHCETDFNI